MRILMLNHEYPPLGGGAGVATKYLAQGLVELGHRVRVLTIAACEQHYEEEGVEVCRLPVPIADGKLAGLRTWLSFLHRAPRWLRGANEEFMPDIVNSHFVFPAGFVVARTLPNAIHVTSATGADIHDPTRRISASRNWVARQMARHAIQGAAAVTTPSNDLTRRAKALFPKADIHTIPWGIAPLCRDKRSRLDLSLPEDAFLVSTLCRLVRRKRLDLLLEAVATLPQEVIVVIMGSGPQESFLRKQTHRLEITNRVRFLGNVTESDKAAYLQAADVFCLPSEHEGFGLVFLEAMSAGTPVITTNVGGQNDIVQDNVDGFLVPVGDVNSLRDRLQRLFHDRATLATMKEEAILRSSLFTPMSTAEGFVRVFEDLR